MALRVGHERAGPDVETAIEERGRLTDNPQHPHQSSGKGPVAVVVSDDWRPQCNAEATEHCRKRCC
jgi:hypothetical protein